MDKVEKRIEAQKVLAALGKSNDQKLYEVFELYKDELRANNTLVYYALLGWVYDHFRELNTKPAGEDYFHD